jgi:hypothetical protein
MSSATTVIATTERPASALAVSLASRGR